MRKPVNMRKMKNEFRQFTIDHEPYVIINEIVYIYGMTRIHIKEFTDGK